LALAHIRFRHPQADAIASTRRENVPKRDEPSAAACAYLALGNEKSAAKLAQRRPDRDTTEPFWKQGAKKLSQSVKYACFQFTWSPA
jgi:hypothetical protein